MAIPFDHLRPPQEGDAPLSALRHLMRAGGVPHLRRAGVADLRGVHSQPLAGGLYAALALLAARTPRELNNACA